MFWMDAEGCICRGIPVPKLIDLAGQRFGRLIAIEREGRKYKCQCDCGKEVLVESAYLRGGDTRSCGCLLKEIYSQRRKNAWSDEALSFIKNAMAEGKGPAEIARSLGWDKPEAVRYCARKNGFR